MEPSVEPFGSPRWICPREPARVRKQFCPDTMAEDPKAIAVGEKHNGLEMTSEIYLIHPDFRITTLMSLGLKSQLAACLANHRLQDQTIATSHGTNLSIIKQRNAWDESMHRITINSSGRGERLRCQDGKRMTDKLTLALLLFPQNLQRISVS